TLRKDRLDRLRTPPGFPVASSGTIAACPCAPVSSGAYVIIEISLLSIQNISMRFGARILFEDVTCPFLAGRRYAITGPNGAGKSTLMKILSGELEAPKGTVSRPKKLGVLQQDQFSFDGFRVIDTVIMGNAPLWEALAERDALYEKPHD